MFFSLSSVRSSPCGTGAHLVRCDQWWELSELVQDSKDHADDQMHVTSVVPDRVYSLVEVFTVVVDNILSDRL